MKILPSDLEKAVAQNIISQAQCDKLLQMLQQHTQHQANFNFTNVLYYFGGLITIGALSLFMTLGWESFGASGLITITLFYLLLSLALTHYFLHTKHLPIPAGITAALAVTLIPLLVFGIQTALGLWSGDSMHYQDYHVYIDWRWITMEIATLVAGAALCAYYRLPFMMMPIAVTLWYMSMDLAPYFYREYVSWTERQLVSLCVGILIIAFAILIDFRNKNRHKDYAFWLYIFGTMAFWGALSSMNSGSEYGKLIYCLINIGMIIVGSLLDRRVFVIFGALGVAGYLGYLAWHTFQDSAIFPLALTIIGFGIIALGIWWQKNEEKIFGNMRKKLLPQLVDRW